MTILDHGARDMRKMRRQILIVKTLTTMYLKRFPILFNRLSVVKAGISLQTRNIFDSQGKRATTLEEQRRSLFNKNNIDNMNFQHTMLEQTVQYVYI